MMTTPEKVSTIYLATDHAGFALKEIIKNWLLELGEYEVIDCGARLLEPEDDFPDFIKLAAQAVSSKPESAKAFIFGGSGQGEAMVANRFSNVRATVYYGGNKELIKLSREHNDANILSFGARFVSAEEAMDVARLWLETNPTLDERHVRRIKKIEALTRELRN
jgi:ribose 5-phosphate isomerase B